MTTPVKTIEASASGYDAAQAMARGGVQHLVAVDITGHVLGVISDRDVREAQPSMLVVKDPAMRNKALAVMRVKDLMTANPQTALATAPVEDVLRAMRRMKIGCVPIIDENNKPVGIVTGMDIVDLAMRLLSERPR